LPELPRFYSTRGAPERSALVPVSPTMMGLEMEEVGKAGERLTQLGQIGWELSQKIEEAADAEKILNTHYKLKDDFRAAEEKFNQRRDYDKFEDDSNKEMEAIRQAYEPSLTSDNLRKAFDRSFMAQSSTLKDVLLKKKVNIITENALGAFDRTFKEGIDEYKNADENKRKAIKANLELESEILVSRNIMTPQVRERALANFDVMAEENREIFEKGNIVDRLNLKNSEEQKLLIEDLDKGVFSKIDALEKATYRGKANENIRTLVKEEEERKDKMKTLELVDDVKTAFKGMGKEVMIKQLQDPEYLKDKGATLTQGSQAITFLTNELATEAVFEKERWGRTQNTFLQKLNRGTLTEGEVMMSDLPATVLSQGDKAWFIDKIKERKFKDLAYTHSNPRVFGETLRSVVMNPKAWDRKNIWDMIGKADKEGNPMGLSPEHAWKIDTIWSNLVKEDPTLSKKYVPFQQSILRLEEYRRGFFFIEPKEKDSKGNLIVSKEETIENDRLHHINLLKFIDMVEKGEDPNIALGIIMKDYVEKKTKSFWDKLFNIALPSMQQDVGIQPREKGPGFLGELKTPSGKFSTEISIGVKIDGKETEIPTLVPTLTKEEVDYLIKGGEPTEKIVNKAVEHAKKRISEGKSPFAQKEKYELNKVYTDAQGRKAKYLGDGKWQLVK